jgi:hypothetical protein
MNFFGGTFFAGGFFGSNVPPTPPTPGGFGGYGGGTAGGPGGPRKNERGPDVKFVFRDGQWVFAGAVRSTDDTDLLTIAHLFLMARKP